MDILIRPLEVKDAYTSVHWRNDPEIWKYTGNRPDKIITIKDEINWINRIISDSSCYRCAILADNKYIGNIYLTSITEIDAEYHIFIGNKEYWNKGIAKKASELILNYARHKLGLKSVYLKVRHENIHAIQLYKKLNFYDVKRDNEFVLMRIDLL